MRPRRIVHFGENVNRWDPIDVIVSNVDRSRFAPSLLRLVEAANVAPLSLPDGVASEVLPYTGRHDLLGAARRLRTRLVHIGADILHVHHFIPSVIAALASFGAPWHLVVTRHYADLVDYAPSLRGKLYARTLEQLIHARADKIVSISSSVEAALRRAGVPPARVVHIPTAFDPAKYAESASPVGEVQKSPGSVVIGAFGRQDAPKRFDRLLKALPDLARRIPSVELWLVGDGAEHRALQNLARDLGVSDRTRFWGWRRDALDVMRAVDLVAHPSVSEAFSQVGAEAMFLGKPLVVTTAVGNRDVVRHRENGVLIRPDDQESLERVLRELIEEPRLRAAIGERAWRFAHANMTISSIVPRVERLYDGLSSGSR